MTREIKRQNICECGCLEKDHEIYKYFDGTKERLFCKNCGENKCRKSKGVE